MQMGPIANQSNASDDELLGSKAFGTNSCGTAKPFDGSGGLQNGRCGYGPRLPLLVISSYSRRNYVDHRLTDRSSTLRFIEDNWNLGRIGNGLLDAIAGTLDGLFDFDDTRHNYRLFLDPLTGQVLGPDTK